MGVKIMTIGTYQKATLHYISWKNLTKEEQVEHLADKIKYLLNKTFKQYRNENGIMLKRTWGPDEGEHIYHVEVYGGELDEENMEITYELYVTVEITDQPAMSWSNLLSWFRSMLKENTPKSFNISYNDENYYCGV